LLLSFFVFVGRHGAAVTDYTEGTHPITTKGTT
jgi:hypothetical protein